MHFLSIMRGTFNIFCKYPVIVVPLLVCCVLYASLTVYLFNFDFEQVSISLQGILCLAFGIIFAYCALFSYGAFMMLEMIEQIETGHKPNLLKAFTDTLCKNFLKALPIIIVWAIIMFVVSVIEALIDLIRDKNKRENSPSSDLSPRGIAFTLVGERQNFSYVRLFFDLVKSGIRMIVFYIYPAIAWENETPLNAVKKGLSGIRNHASQFFKSFASIELIAFFIFIPPIAMITCAERFNVDYSNFAWQLLVIYVVSAFTYYLYLQQMCAAILYLWNMKWEKEAEQAVREGRPVPSLSDIPEPDLLDDIPDLLL